MVAVQDGQCGLCAHFGEEHAKDQTLVQIRTSKKAPENFTDECDHPQHRPLHLRVAANSGCEGFEPARN